MDSSIQAWVQCCRRRQPERHCPGSRRRERITRREMGPNTGRHLQRTNRHGRRGDVREMPSGRILLGKTRHGVAYRTLLPREPRDLAPHPAEAPADSAPASAGMVPVAHARRPEGRCCGRVVLWCDASRQLGLLPMDGVFPFAKSLEARLLHNTAATCSRSGVDGQPRRVRNSRGRARPMPHVEPPMAAPFQQTLARLRAQGGDSSVDIAAMLAKLVDAADRQSTRARDFTSQRFKSTATAGGHGGPRSRGSRSRGVRPA